MNADSLMNKRNELKDTVSSCSIKPDVIGIVEVKAKKCNTLPQNSELFRRL